MYPYTITSQSQQLQQTKNTGTAAISPPSVGAPGSAVKAPYRGSGIIYVAILIVVVAISMYYWSSQSPQTPLATIIPVGKQVGALYVSNVIVQHVMSIPEFNLTYRGTLNITLSSQSSIGSASYPIHASYQKYFNKSRMLIEITSPNALSSSSPVDVISMIVRNGTMIYYCGNWFYNYSQGNYTCFDSGNFIRYESQKGVSIDALNLSELYSGLNVTSSTLGMGQQGNAPCLEVNGRIGGNLTVITKQLEAARNETGSSLYQATSGYYAACLSADFYVPLFIRANISIRTAALSIRAALSLNATHADANTTSSSIADLPSKPGSYPGNSTTAASCSPSNGFTCGAPVLSTSGNLTFTIAQTAGGALYNVELACAAAASASGMPGPGASAFRGGLFGASHTLSPTSNVQVTNLPCYSTDNVIMGNTPAGTVFSGFVWANYTASPSAVSASNLRLTIRVASVTARAS